MKTPFLISSTIVAILCASCMKEAESTPQTTTDESIISQNHDTSNEAVNATDEITFSSSKGSINTIRAQRTLTK